MVPSFQNLISTSSKCSQVELFAFIKLLVLISPILDNQWELNESYMKNCRSAVYLHRVYFQLYE